MFVQVLSLFGEASFNEAMIGIDKALETQLTNLQERAGKTLKQLCALLKKSGLEKHGEMVKMLKADLKMGHGDANTLVHHYRKASEPKPAADASADPLDGIYTGAKAPLRALHEAVMAKVLKLGHFDVAPKKSNVSLRRKMQFALVGPGTKGRLEIGINLRDFEGTDRLVAQKPGGMCQFKVWLTEKREVDKELLGWIKRAFDAAE